MSEERAAEAAESGSGAASEDEVWGRDTAPQTPFTLRQVWIGLLIVAIGAAIAFGAPLVFS